MELADILNLVDLIRNLRSETKTFQRLVGRKAAAHPVIANVVLDLLQLPTSPCMTSFENRLHADRKPRRHTRKNYKNHRKFCW